jgi:hypothetical protein
VHGLLPTTTTTTMTYLANRKNLGTALPTRFSLISSILSLFGFERGENEGSIERHTHIEN